MRFWRPQTCPWFAMSPSQAQQHLQNLFSREMAQARRKGRFQLVVILGPYDPHLERSLRASGIGILSFDPSLGPHADLNFRHARSAVNGWLLGGCIGSLVVSSPTAFASNPNVSQWLTQLLRRALRARVPVVVRDPPDFGSLSEYGHKCTRQILRTRWSKFGSTGRRWTTFIVWNVNPAGPDFELCFATGPWTEDAPSKSFHFLPALLSARVAGLVVAALDARRFEAPQRILNAAYRP